MAKRNLRTALHAAAGAVMLTAGAAQAAEVDINGIIDVWVGSTESPGDDDSTLVLGGSGMSTSYLGVNVTEELEGGLTAVGALQMFYRPDTAEQGRFNGDAFYARAANVGVMGDFGKFTAGRNTSPYFLPVVFTNPFADSFTFSPAILQTFLGVTQGDTGWSNSLSYSAPTMGGVSANLVYQFGETEGDSGDKKVGANVVYRGGGLTATVAGQQMNYGLIGSDAGPLDDTHTAYLLGAAYDFEVVTVYGQYQRVENDRDAGDEEADTFTTGVSVPAGPGKVLAAYAQTDTETDTADTERTSYAVGYDYILSSRTDVYANYFHDEVEDQDGATYGVGVRHRF